MDEFRKSIRVVCVGLLPPVPATNAMGRNRSCQSETVEFKTADCRPVRQPQRQVGNGRSRRAPLHHGRTMPFTSESTVSISCLGSFGIGLPVASHVCRRVSQEPTIQPFFPFSALYGTVQYRSVRYNALYPDPLCDREANVHDSRHITFAACAAVPSLTLLLSTTRCKRRNRRR